MIYQYQALDSKGDNISDFIDASSEAAARQKIRSQKMYLVSIKEHNVIKNEDSVDKHNRFSSLLEQVSDKIALKFNTKQIGIFSRQLATLLKAGLPLLVAITDIIDQIEKKQFRNIVADIKEKIEEGSSFSNALARHKSIFSPMYINMVRVGENLGSLDQVIERLADMEQKNNILKSRIQAALYYPGFMFVFSIIVVIFLLVNVIPSISEMFIEQKRELPLPTEIVIGLSNFLSSYWYLLPVLIVAFIYFFKRYSHTTEGKRKIDELKLKIPLVKNLYNKLIVSRFTQNLGVLMNNRVDIIKSFEIVQKIVNNSVIEEKISEAADQIKEGSTVSQALRKSDFLPYMVLGMIAAGEASDNLDTMMLNIGGVYETEIDLTVTSLTSLIEPIIIIMMGFMIGMIVMAVMLPMMEMNLLVQ